MPTRRGWVRFDQLQVNDEVLSSPEREPLGPVEYKRVEEVFVTYARIWHVHVGGQVIRTTTEHPFYVWGKGWVPAGELKPGDRLRSHDGRMVTVEEVCDGGHEEVVYNCRVADWHTYFVGAEDWGFTAWAHNIYWLTAEQRAQAAARARGEGVILSQWGTGWMKRGIDFLSYTGIGKKAQLFLNEVKAYSNLVPSSKFTAFGLGKGGPRILELNIQQAERAIRRAGLDQATTRSLIRQIHDQTAQIRLIGPKSVFDPLVTNFLQSQTGFPVRVGF